ncbi:MAG TPA: hypothetical protein VN724_01070 [Pyrinomonadaceae bacterium]|nr:hypothetical protein [Pyrinomonadaceae bacterium]
MTRLLLLVIVITTFSGCARPGDHAISPNCEWIESDSRTLNLATSADRRHLRFDAVTAEDMAIRWADQRFGHRTEWDQRCQECMETLFTGLAKTHSVDVATARQYSRERDVVVDAAVILGFASIYVVAAYLLAGRIRKRFPPGEPGFWVMALTMAGGVSLVGVLSGIFGSIIVEEYRLNTAHLSFRMFRIPFRQHWVILFVAGAIIFTLAALIRYRKKLDTA